MSSAPGRRGTHWALVAMILGAIVMVYPYAFMIGSSLKTRKEFAEARSSLIPPRYQPAEVLAHLRGEDSARDWPGADWPVYQNYHLSPVIVPTKVSPTYTSLCSSSCILISSLIFLPQFMEWCIPSRFS